MNHKSKNKIYCTENTNHQRVGLLVSENNNSRSSLNNVLQKPFRRWKQNSLVGLQIFDLDQHPLLVETLGVVFHGRLFAFLALVIARFP